MSISMGFFSRNHSDSASADTCRTILCWTDPKHQFYLLIYYIYIIIYKYIVFGLSKKLYKIMKVKLLENTVCKQHTKFKPSPAITIDVKYETSDSHSR